MRLASNHSVLTELPFLAMHLANDHNPAYRNFINLAKYLLVWTQFLKLQKCTAEETGRIKRYEHGAFEAMIDWDSWPPVELLRVAASQATQPTHGVKPQSDATLAGPDRES